VPETVCVTYLTLIEWSLLKEIENTSANKRLVLQGISGEKGELTEMCSS
jgi:hypothetical protein